VSDGNKAASGSGGAIYLSGSTLTADNCVFRHNSAGDNGGAIAAFTSTVILDAEYPSVAALSVAGSDDHLSLAGVAPQATACQPASGQCSSLHDNTAGTVVTLTGSGGAVYSSDSLLSVNQTYLHRNAAGRGGAIYQAGATSRGYISNTLVYSNTSTQPLGAGIRVAAGAFTITHGTMANNVGGAGLSPGTASTYVYNTIIWGNSTASFNALAAASCNIDQGGVAGLVSNPLFVSAGAGEDYRLRPNSPGIDACASGLPTDINDRVRPFGALYDMGAHEVLVRQVFLPVVTRQ
jgi:predicted outer membrane repeat protein